MLHWCLLKGPYSPALDAENHNLCPVTSSDIQSKAESLTMVARTIAPSVLIADAEAYVCRVFEAKLAKDNRFRVVCVTSALDAYQVVLEQPADILLWDMRLRETLRLLPLVRALCPHSALLLMTTDDRLILDPALSHLDVADILVKPFGLDILAERVGATLTLPQAVGPTAYMDLG